MLPRDVTQTNTRHNEEIKMTLGSRVLAASLIVGRFQGTGAWDCHCADLESRNHELLYDSLYNIIGPRVGINLTESIQGAASTHHSQGSANAHSGRDICIDVAKTNKMARDFLDQKESKSLNKRHIRPSETGLGARVEMSSGAEMMSEMQVCAFGPAPRLTGKPKRPSRGGLSRSSRLQVHQPHRRVSHVARTEMKAETFKISMQWEKR